jgi:two-component system, LuxR family, response regulator FixJ
MSGLALQQQLTMAQCPIPIIFITAHGDAETRTRALYAGAVAFLDKPFSDEVFLRAVEAALPSAWGGG